MRALTARQYEVLLFIAWHFSRHGFPPTHLEICAHFGWRSTVAVTDHLRLIENKGYIERTPNKSRGLRITAEGWSAVGGTR